MDTVWFDKDWKESTKVNANYFRVYKKYSNGFLVYDKFLSGVTQMMAEASQINPTLVKEGKASYYNNDGSLVSHGYYTNDEASGKWVVHFKFCNDSSIYEIEKGNKKHYTRVCKCCLDNDSSPIYTVAEVMPQYPGGNSEMAAFIQKNLVYPAHCREMGIGGKVFLKFHVDENGNLQEIQVLKGAGNIDLDNAAKNVVWAMPQWKPGMQNNKPVRVYYNLPINFRLTDDSPYFIFNTNCTDENYTEARLLLQNESPKKELIFNLLKNSKDSNNPNIIYALGVSAFFNGEKKLACRCFKKIAELNTSETGSITGMSKKYLEKFCN
jgi:TonB family protein